MQPSDEDSADISNFESLLNDNWNERKRLVEEEFEVRSEVQSLIQAGKSREALAKARDRENECRTGLTRNDTEYQSLIERWTAEAFAPKS
jgi:hypothetical protein